MENINVESQSIDFCKLKEIILDPIKCSRLFNHKIPTIAGTFTQHVVNAKFSESHIDCVYIMSDRTQLKVRFLKLQDGSTDIIIKNNWTWTYLVLFGLSINYFTNGEIVGGVTAFIIGGLLLYFTIKFFGHLVFERHKKEIMKRITSRIDKILTTDY